MNDSLNDLYILFIGTIVALNSILIPVSYQIVSSSLKDLLNRDSHKILIEEESFLGNLYASFGCLVIFLVPLVFDVFPVLDPKISPNQGLVFFQWVFLILTLLFFCGFMLAFTRLSYRIYEYSSNAEEIVYQKVQSRIENYLERL
ncbi:hypothetical protein [Pedobacter paludis]|uniref:Uncharacterized protein n=1 Tax=Pedobacter paludis TaxID=2203212 RepID=A0A317F2G8_9SPHI|nr:hypothetical protein [Pedobacter paludis]PWS33364.1 hypothetical protein DF947_01690 [Pedobacter paludis]